MTQSAEHTSGGDLTPGADDERRARLFRLLHDELSQRREIATDRGAPADEFDNSLRKRIDQLRDDSIGD